MRVVCTALSLDTFSEDWLLKRFGDRVYIPKTQYNLTLGREYTVYGLVFENNVPWYYLCSEEWDTYPVPYAREFFEIVDPRLSVYWRLSVSYSTRRETYTAITFEEWANDRIFYEHLVDGDRTAEDIFHKYRILMDSE